MGEGTQPLAGDETAFVRHVGGRAPRVIAETIAICALTGLLAAGYLYALGLFGLAPKLRASQWAFLEGWMTAVTSGSIGLGILLLYLLLAPVRRALVAVARGAAPSDPKHATGRRRALNLPWHVALVMLALWLAPLVTLPAAAALSDDAPGRAEIALAIAGSVFVALVHVTFSIYLLETVVRRRVLPVLVPDGRVSRVPGAHGVPVAVKLGLMFVSTGVFPIFVFAAFVANDTVTVSGTVFLGATAVVLGALQCALIARSIAAPLDRLHASMARLASGDYSARAPVESADKLGRVSDRFNRMVAEVEQAEYINETFGRYVSPAVRNAILRGHVPTRGERRAATVLFSDIRGFTTLSEQLEPEEVVALLNSYLDAMVDVLVEYGATVDKFMGDAIVAFFGAPVARDDHAALAVHAALAMLERVDALNARRASHGEHPIEIGIGIHTGDVVAGNIGSARKMEYTVIGDTVNTTARIEKLNKRFGTRLLVSEAVLERVALDVESRRLPPVAIEGKQREVALYEVVALSTLSSGSQPRSKTPPTGTPPLP